MWVITDGLYPVVINPARHGELAEIRGEYIHRASDRTGLAAIQGIRQLPQHQDRWILTNEYDLHYPISEAVNIVTELVNTIQAAYPNPETPQLYLNMGSNVTDLTYVSALWDALPEAIANRINGFTAHRYTNDLSGVNFRRDFRIGSAWMNKRGLGALKFFCGEFGLDAAYHTQDQAAQFLSDVWAAMKDVVWLDGLFYYYANFDGLNYVTLCNNTGTRLTKAGRAWRDVKFAL